VNFGHTSKTGRETPGRAIRRALQDKEGKWILTPEVLDNQQEKQSRSPEGQAKYEKFAWIERNYQGGVKMGQDKSSKTRPVHAGKS